MNESSSPAKTRLAAAGHAKDTARRLAWWFLIVAVILELLVGFALTDYWLALSPAVRLLGFGLLLLSLGVGFFGWLRLRRRPTTMKEAALDAEAERPELGCMVSTAAEYLTGQRAITKDYEPELVAALEHQAAQSLAKSQVPYERRLFGPAGFLGFALLTLLIFAAAVPLALTAFKRTVVPWSNTTYTHVEVQPGTVDIPVGRDLIVTNRFSGRTPKNPTLHWRETNQTAWQPVALTRSDDGLHLHQFKSLQHSVQYRVTGDDAASDVYDITTYVPPEVRALKIGVAYPEYTGVKPYERETPNLTVLRASQLTFRITASAALATARLRFSEMPPLDLSPGPDNLWTGTLTAAKETDYWIELADARGHKGGNEKPYHLKVLPDRPPKVAIVEPGQDIRADPTNTVPLKVAASDDYGISEIKIVYHKLGSPEQTLKVTQTNAEAGEIAGRVELALAPLDLKSYEIVAYHAEALDNNTLDGPGKGLSPVYFIEITSEEGSPQSSKGQPRNGQKLNLLAVQKQIVADVAALDRKAPAEQFNELSSRQKEAGDFAEMYQEAMNGLGAPQEALKLMEDAVRQMKETKDSLAARKRDAALPTAETALADLYRVLQMMPQLQNMPTQQQEQQQNRQQDPMVQVVLEAIKKQKKLDQADQEIAEALEKARQLAQSQAGVNAALDQKNQPDRNNPSQSQSSSSQSNPQNDQNSPQSASSSAQSGQGKQGQQGKKAAQSSQSKPTQGKPDSQAKSGQSGQNEKAENGQGQNEQGKSGQNGDDQKAADGSDQEGGKDGQQADDKGQTGQGDKGQRGKNGKDKKTGDQPGQGGGKGDQQAQDDAQAGQGDQGQQNQDAEDGQEGNQPGKGQGKGDDQAKAQGKSGKGKQGSKDANKPGQGRGGQGAEDQQEQESLADQEEQLSQEAAALAEKLERLAGKDTRLGHNAGRKVSQASGQMASAAASLRKGMTGQAGTEGGIGLANLNQAIAAMERVLKGQPKLTDVAAEDYPKEFEAMISEYLRKLSHAQ